MKFDEIPLFQAIQRVYPEMDGPRGDSWLREREKRSELYRGVINAYLEAGYEHGFPWSLEQVLTAWATYGKQPRLEGSDQKKIDLICELARAHGQQRCFYAGRASSECNNEVAVDRIKPGSRGGAYTIANCVISCQLHNSARGDIPMDDFLNRP